MAGLRIPKSVDTLLDALARRKGLTGEMASRIGSVGRHVMRAFAESPVSSVEIGKAIQRAERCLEVIGGEPSSHPDTAIADEVKRLIDCLREASAPSSLVDSPVAEVAALPAEPADIVPPAAPEVAMAERDWYWFVLEELNGLGTQLAYQRQHGELEMASRTERRVRVILDTLEWNAAAALRETWAFVERRVRDFDDVWGPHLVVVALEPSSARVRNWQRGLPHDMRRATEEPSIEIQRRTE